MRYLIPSLFLLIGTTLHAQFEDCPWQFYPGACGFDQSIRALASSDSILYAGGDFFDVDGIRTRALVQWNGEKWDKVGIVEGPGFDVDALLWHEGNLYVGGSFDNVEDTLNVIVLLDGMVLNGMLWGLVLILQLSQLQL